MSALHPKRQTPYLAIAAQAAWACILAATNSYRALFTRVIYTEWLFFALLAAGIFVLHRRGQYTPRFLAFGYPLLPIVSCVTSAAIAANQIWAAPRESSGVSACFLWAFQYIFSGPIAARQSTQPEEQARMPTIDFHNHFYPPEYIKALEQGPSAVRITHRFRRKSLPALSRRLQRRRPRPSRHRLSRAGARRFRRRYASPQPDHAGHACRGADLRGARSRASSMTLLPASSLKSADVSRRSPRCRFAIPPPRCASCERAMKQLGFPGAMVFSNINGVALSDQSFWPVWEAANELGAVIHIHPDKSCRRRSDD